jgi:hypothetical protein
MERSKTQEKTIRMENIIDIRNSMVVSLPWDVSPPLFSLFAGLTVQ